MNLLTKNLLMAFAALGALTSQVSADKSAPAKFDPATVLAYQGDVQLTQQEIDAAFSKVPETERLRFIRDGAKVDQLIRALLTRKIIAANAARSGFDKNPIVAARVRLEAEKELADAWMQEIVSKAPPADYEALAREDYLANPDAYRSPTVLDVSHILIGTEERSKAEARDLANRLLSELRKNPSDFEDMVMEYSDDPARKENGGRYAEMRRGMMVAPFERAAFALTEPGAISDPVLTDYGYHIIRLNNRSGNELRTYGEVKDEAEARAESAYFKEYRESYLRKVLSDPVVVPEEAVEVMARRHFGEDLERAPGMTQ